MAFPFSSVLVANRGEIAVRIMRTLRGLGLRSVAVYSDADAGARHVIEADEALRIGPGPALASYLDTEALLRAAAVSGAEAVHPGYGFLSEDATFARACVDAGLVFIGPPPETVELMGDKIRAKRAVAAAGVPVVPGRTKPGMTDGELAEVAHEIGFPALIKPSAGGGGKGMHLVHDGAGLAAAIASARREATSAFGNDDLLVERWIEQPHHIEIQIFADVHGAVVHLGERECSLQRRHQKIVEEAPSPLLDPATRAAMGGHALEVARRCGYVGAGTVEFVVPGDSPADHYFLEMNTRLQVEHPVTELVTGMDLVELQIRVAAGEPLPFTQDDVVLDGHAIEARVYAEDPDRGFLPTGGPVLVAVEPALPHVRVDSSLRAGSTVSTLYDPLLAKVVAWGPDRDAALRRLRRALSGTAVLGFATNIAFLSDLLAHPDVVAGHLDTGLVDRLAEQPRADGGRPPAHVAAAAALAVAAWRDPGNCTDRWGVHDGWRLGGRAWIEERFTVAGGNVSVRRRDVAGAWDVEVEFEGAGVTTLAGAVAGVTGADLTVTLGDQTLQYHRAAGDSTVWIGWQGAAWAFRRQETASPAGGAATAAAGEAVRSPMPGTVVAVHVTSGDWVTSGEPLVVVEAMKMEHTLMAPHDGVVDEVPAEVGRQVSLDQLLVTVTAGAQP
jgi:acetyl-CoA/propionyl-CoA carboxylase biotin carboxyl carrier protein